MQPCTSTIWIIEIANGAHDADPAVFIGGGGERKVHFTRAGTPRVPPPLAHFDLTHQHKAAQLRARSDHTII